MTQRTLLSRRDLVILSAAAIPLSGANRLQLIGRFTVSVNVMFDRGAHSAKGLSAAEIEKFRACQERARREYATSGIAFDVQNTEGAYLRQQGYSEIPEQFLVRRTINIFVT